MGSPNRGADIVEPIPDLDDDEQSVDVEAKEDVDRARRVRLSRRNLEPASPTMTLRRAQD
jgi:hypothetical protein